MCIFFLCWHLLEILQCINCLMGRRRWFGIIHNDSKGHLEDISSSVSCINKWIVLVWKRCSDIILNTVGGNFHLNKYFRLCRVKWNETVMQLFKLKWKVTPTPHPHNNNTHTLTNKWMKVSDSFKNVGSMRACVLACFSLPLFCLISLTWHYSLITCAPVTCLPMFLAHACSSS